jgi:exopolysaccharide biosynthesis polyprenyl glycosylphosphotransferase
MAMILAFMDAAVVVGAVLGTLALTTGPQWPGAVSSAVHGLAVALGCVAVASCYDLYDFRRVRSFRDAMPRLAQAIAAGTLLAAAVHAAFGHCAITPIQLLGSGTVALGFALVSRAGVLALMQATPHRQRVLMIGGGPLAQELIAELHGRPDLRQRVVGVVEDRSGPPVAGCPRLGALKDVLRIVDEVGPHRVIVTLASRRGSMPLKALLQLRVHGIAVEDGVEVYERLTGKIAIEALTPSSLIFSQHFRPRRLDLALARALSLPLVALALVLVSPLLALIALAIKLDSSGPVLFVQERVGRGGRLFKLIKFRTMHPARGTTSHWARDNHARMTRVGRRLRQFRLDELPQLFNIVRGDMNLVGPRPHPVSNVPLFEMVMRNTPECGETIPYYALRSMVRPGLSGWAQVRYQYANDLEEEIEKMRYDLYYVKHMSAWLDLGILFATLKIVLRGRESAQPAPAPAVRRTEPVVARSAVAGLRLAGGARSSSETVAPLVPARAGAFETAPAAMSIPATPPAARA